MPNSYTILKKENNFFAAGVFDTDISSEELQEIIDWKVEENDWENEKTVLNSISILKDIMIESGINLNTISVVPIYKGIADSTATELSRYNYERSSTDIKDGLIVFSENIFNLLKEDYVLY